MTKVLITGGSGFIGTNLTQALMREKFEVLNIDVSPPPVAEHLPYWEKADILKYKLLEEAALKFLPDVIIHLAAVTDLDGKELSYYRTNIEGTKNIIDIAAKLPSLKKVIFTSSMYVCQPGYIPSGYDDYKPHTFYGESKVKGELLVKAIKDANYSHIIIRPTSIWGPWFKIPYIDFFNIVYRGRYFDFGRTCTKTYGYVGNTVFQIMQLMKKGGTDGRTFYIGDRVPVPISEWANEISLAMGKGKIRSIPYGLIKSLAVTGDLLTSVGVKFPMTSFRLSNMTTNNILPLDDLYEITGEGPFTREMGIRKTLEWLAVHKGYKMRLQHDPSPTAVTQSNYQYQ